VKRFKLGVDELDTVVQAIVQALPHGGIVILEGDLASGKTTLTQAFARHIGEEGAVTSPTFSLQQCYGERLFHYDLYNKGLDNFLSLGLLEELEKEGYHLIEWGDETLFAFLHSAGIAAIHIHIDKEENERTYTMKEAEDA